MKLKNIIKEKIKKFGIIEAIVFVAYIIIVLFLATRHECWQDEAQSWLIARDLNPIQVLEQLKYEGHSFLWYYILMPFAKLGFPMKVQNYISAIFSIATVYFILKKAPFRKILKILIIFSGGLIYFYSVMARPYCMIPLLLVGIATLYKNKTQHPYLYAILIGLLAHTHLVMVPTSILLTIDFWGNELLIKHKEMSKEEKIKLFKSFLIALVCIIIYMIIGIQAAFACEIVNDYTRIKNISKTNENVIQLIENAITVTCANLYGKNIVPVYYKVVMTLVFLLVCIGSKNNIKQACIFWTQFLFTLLIHSFFWMVVPNRLYFVRALSKFVRCVSVRRLSLCVRVGGKEADAVAKTYGQLTSVLYPILTALSQVITVRRKQVHIIPDFLIGQIEVKMRMIVWVFPLGVLAAALTALVKAVLLWFRKTDKQTATKPLSSNGR